MAAQQTLPMDISPDRRSLPMDIPPDRRSPDREQQGTDYNFLGPARANDSTSKPYHASFALDGASDDHLQPPSEGAYASGSPLPSVEPTQSTSNPHRTQRTPTPSTAHTGVNSRVSSPQKYLNPVIVNSETTGLPLPSTASVQSVAKAQPIQQGPTQNGVQAGPESEPSNISQPSKMTTKKSRQTTLHPPAAERSSTMPEALHGQPQQNASANVDDANISTSSNAQPPKRKLDDDPADTETKSTKKQRGQSKKNEASTTTVEPRGAIDHESPKERGKPTEDDSSASDIEHQDAAKDEAPKKQGRPKKEQGPTGSVKQQSAAKGELSKKRGRPKKEEGPTLNDKSPRVSQDDKPAKRGRPKKETNPQTTTELNSLATRNSKRRGRPTKEADSTQAVEPASILAAADTPKKRGRPKKAEEDTQAAETTYTPKKRGRAKKDKDIANASDLQGSSIVETTKKRGRPKVTGQGETAKSLTPAKRGRPKKK